MVEVCRQKIRKKELYVHIVDLLRQDRKKEASQLIWPWIEPNEWRDRIYDHLAAHPYCAIMGHGSAAKTFTSCEWFLLDWWTDPKNTALIITSDTIPAMERRIWSDIKRLWKQTSVPMPGFLVDSKRLILHDPMDKKNAIAGIAAEDKDSQTKIQGLHTKRVRVIIDEADNKDSQSVWKALSNLETSGELKVVALANPSNRMSEFGRHTEPIGGWGSLGDQKTWVSKMGWNTLRLDGLESPNIVAGYDKFPFLLLNKSVQSIRTKKGENNPEWWTYVRAIYAPQGDLWTVFPSTLVPECRKPMVWYADTIPIAACDPALEDGGDACVLTLGRMGRLASDPQKFAVEMQRQIPINTINTKIPIDIDRGGQIIALCKEHGVTPEHFILDASGEGRGISVHLQSAWVPGTMSPIHAIRFGGAPTEMPIGSDDGMRAVDRFDRFVSELWYVAREWAKNGSLWISESIPGEFQTDMESRLYRLIGSSGKISVETKREMKKRNHKSPDYGDSGCLLIHIARLISSQYGFKPGRFSQPKGNFFERNKKRAWVGNANYGVADN